MNYEIVIGLEIHAQLKTKSKMFTDAANVLGDAPVNTAINPVVMGHPGTLPVLNKAAVEQGILMALSLNCKITADTRFDRKNYFYPDLPKGYQISQFDKPLASGGHVDLMINGKKRVLHLERLHLEEDAGKNTHVGDKSLVDFNRAGTPLAEIVTKPDLRSPEEARLFMQELRLIARYCGVSDADMEKGHLRCDANISLRPIGDPKYYEKIEVKNLNSFKAVEKALAYEVKRQEKLWDDGNPPNKQETRGWDENKGVTVAQRTKEGSSDYRYFPEPDLVPVKITPKDVENMKKTLPELPEEKRLRFVKEYGLSYEDADVLALRKDVADYFEEVISELQEWVKSDEGRGVWKSQGSKLVKYAQSWITTELFKQLKADNKQMADINVTPENMAELITMLSESKISSSAGQTIFEKMYKTGEDPSIIAEQENLLQLSDSGEMEGIVKEVIKNCPDQVAQFKSGKEGVLQFLIGQVMKESKGKANPTVAAELLRKLI